MVTEGTCNVCNRYYIEYGIYPFLSCINGHAFHPSEGICANRQVFCPKCKALTIVRTAAEGDGPGFCCDEIDCKICDWYGDPDHCNLARDPQDARKNLPPSYSVADPISQREFTIHKDGYQVTMHQLSAKEALDTFLPSGPVTDDETIRKMAGKVQQALMKVKLLHRGNVDIICGDIQDECNRVIRAKYPQGKVIVQPKWDGIKMSISISANDSITAWMLHKISERVKI